MTFFFSDIEGSTRLEIELGTERYLEVRQLQRRLLREAFTAHGGIEQGTEGDSFFVIFPDPRSAVSAAITAQRSLGAVQWPSRDPVRIRMGLHHGLAMRSDDGTYGGIDINRAARIAAAGHGEQILVSDTLRSALGPRPGQAEEPRGADRRAAPIAGGELLTGDEFGLLDLGRHRLKDIPEPEWLFQVTAGGLRADFPPLRTIDNRPNNLPAQVTRFIGRRRESAEVRGLLRTARLVTLTGPGGTGKTRLAQEVGTEALADFADGVFWVALGAIAGAEFVAPAVAAALGIADDGTRPLADVLADVVQEREQLLVLDNFEHVVAAASLVTVLLERAPRLRILVTSRAALRVRGEHEYLVPPLEVPDPSRALPPEAILANEAVALFVDRATAVRPDFDPTPAMLSSIVAICARLDGLPLAIELAAARVRLFAPAALLARLEDALGLLSGGGRDVPERQQTLRGAIAWSYDLLEPPERLLFARLAVFAGGCGFDAAAAVCDAEGELGARLLDALESLVEKSLVRQADLDGEPRFRMLQVIREFGLERLAAGPDARAVRDRHLAYFADLARQAEPFLTTTDSVPWLDRLEVEQDNIRAALRWAREGDQAEMGLAAAGRLWRFWHQRGHLGEGRGMLVDLLSCPAASQRTVARAIALNGAGGIAYWQNDFATARAEYEEARDIFHEHGDAGGEADVLYSLGYLELIDGRHAAGLEAFDRARSTFSALGDRQGVGRVLQGILLTEMVQRDVEAVRRTTAEALPLLRELGERFGVASVLSVHGRAELIADEVDAADELLRESLRLFFEAGDDVDTSMVLEDLGAVAFKRGDVERAVRLAAASAALRERMGGGPPRPLVLPVDYVDAARERLALADRIRAEAEGSAMETAEAVRYALSVADEPDRSVIASVPASAAESPDARPSASVVSGDATRVT